MVRVAKPALLDRLGIEQPEWKELTDMAAAR